MALKCVSASLPQRRVVRRAGDFRAPPRVVVRFVAVPRVPVLRAVRPAVPVFRVVALRAPRPVARVADLRVADLRVAVFPRAAVFFARGVPRLVVALRADFRVLPVREALLRFVAVRRRGVGERPASAGEGETSSVSCGLTDSFVIQSAPVGEDCRRCMNRVRPCTPGRVR